MPALNQCNFIGNLTKDPELRQTPQGTSVCGFSLAINRVYYVGEGNAREKREEVTYADCEAWGRHADAIGKWCKKGKALHVTARFKMDAWKDKDTGEEKRRAKFHVEDFQFLDSGKSTDATQREPGEAGPPTGAPRPPRDPDLDAPPGDDIPF